MNINLINEPHCFQGSSFYLSRNKYKRAYSEVKSFILATQAANEYGSIFADILIFVALSHQIDLFQIVRDGKNKTLHANISVLADLAKRLRGFFEKYKIIEMFNTDPIDGRVITFGGFGTTSDGISERQIAFVAPLIAGAYLFKIIGRPEDIINIPIKDLMYPDEGSGKNVKSLTEVANIVYQFAVSNEDGFSNLLSDTGKARFTRLRMTKNIHQTMRETGTIKLLFETIVKMADTEGLETTLTNLPGELMSVDEARKTVRGRPRVKWESLILDHDNQSFSSGMLTTRTPEKSEKTILKGIQKSLEERYDPDAVKIGFRMLCDELSVSKARYGKKDLEAVSLLDADEIPDEDTIKNYIDKFVTSYEIVISRFYQHLLYYISHLHARTSSDTFGPIQYQTVRLDQEATFTPITADQYEEIRSNGFMNMLYNEVIALAIHGAVDISNINICSLSTSIIKKIISTARAFSVQNQQAFKDYRQYKIDEFGKNAWQYALIILREKKYLDIEAEIEKGLAMSEKQKAFIDSQIANYHNGYNWVSSLQHRLSILYNETSKKESLKSKKRFTDFIHSDKVADLIGARKAPSIYNIVSSDSFRQLLSSRSVGKMSITSQVEFYRAYKEVHAISELQTASTDRSDAPLVRDSSRFISARSEGEEDHD